MPLPKRRPSLRNQQILNRRQNGESLASIGLSFNISAARVKQIFEREDMRMKRAAELEEAAALPQQPNPLQLQPHFRKRLAELCGKADFRPEDVMALDYSPAMFFLRLPLSRRDWKELSAWMMAGGFTLERHPPKPHRARPRASSV